ncbi:hypothetical protein KIL84_000489 [Mauremys mutica]|uniref:Uncharacterized protein n=1 Tax=Mauremys mutica TaxID=74926 RepID=A0A9D3WWN4_9SAUR|nr:hypothetical protein KIL84_000489 [Mauremys mutica]
MALPRRGLSQGREAAYTGKALARWPECPPGPPLGTTDPPDRRLQLPAIPQLRPWPLASCHLRAPPSRGSQPANAPAQQLPGACALAASEEQRRWSVGLPRRRLRAAL